MFVRSNRIPPGTGPAVRLTVDLPNRTKIVVTGRVIRTVADPRDGAFRVRAAARRGIAGVRSAPREAAQQTPVGAATNSPCPVWISEAFRSGTILVAVLFGLIGFAAFRYGKKNNEPRPLFLGIVLMAYGYFVSNAWVSLGIGTVLTVLLFFP